MSNSRVTHGFADERIGPDVAANLTAKLGVAGADWKMDSYSGARHRVTIPDAGGFGIANLVNYERADRLSWARMQRFFGEVLQQRVR